MPSFRDLRARTSEFALSPTWLQDFFRRYTFLALVALSVIAGFMFGATVAYQASMTEEAQEVAGLANYRPNLVTRVVADDGKTVVGEFSLERRIPVSYEQIPDQMKNAIFAIEDDRFFQHIGIDPIRIVTSAFKNVAKGRKAEGGSTLTQQLARALFLSPEKTYTRKIKEVLLSLQIERYFTKEQIMEMYCNQIFLGGGAYGFEAGAQYYFSKSLKDLSLDECALLAGLPKAPSYYSPTRDEKAALERRNIVLYRMHEEGYISDDEYNRARQTRINLNLNPQQSNNNSIYGYFVEEVRQESEETFGTYQTQTGGMNIYTTIDAAAQREAVRAVRRGLHAYEDRHGKRWRGKLTNVIDQKIASDLSHYNHPDWLGDYLPGEYIYGLVANVTPANAEVRFGDYKAVVTEANTKWAGGPPSRLLKKGDLAVFKVTKADNDKKVLEVTLDQLPSVDGALVCIESKTGEVKAMVGGYDFSTRKFNNATQAERQTGSTFKPFIYATAIEEGFTPDTTISAGAFTDPGTGWSPSNYDGSSGGGMLPLRSALQQSLNVVAVRLLSVVGVDKGAEMVKRFGLPNPMKRVLPSALGATEEPLLDMVSAYSAFSNMGMRVKPHLIQRVTDADGEVKMEWNPEPSKVISPFVASQMQDMMRGVVTGGTAGSIMSNKELSKRMICGKTGTVNDFTDAWFIGYTPTYTAGVWIGYPGLKKTLGNKEAGSVAALPMWIQFMEKFLKDKPNDKFPKPPAPDREIIAKRAEAQRKIVKAQADEAETKALTNDETSDKAKDAAQEDESSKEPGARPVPKMTEPDSGLPPRIDTGKPPKSGREERQRPAFETVPPIRPPVVRPGDPYNTGKDDKKKRGKNGNPF
ncbi:MAG TPA: PBP1A family penicillin-binding protein [Blastocatellia bacterium]|nr:PBP1A family penicillin-binding protein [Blastocatellia bacterium]